MDSHKWSLGFTLLAFLFITSSSAELIIKQVSILSTFSIFWLVTKTWFLKIKNKIQVTQGRGIEYNNSYSLTSNLGTLIFFFLVKTKNQLLIFLYFCCCNWYIGVTTRELRDERPSSKIVTITSFSVIKDRGEPYESSIFEAAGYKWLR